MTYYICSDIHSFYTPLITALNKNGFDVNNQDHMLVVLGDVFDRGFETLEVYNFLKSIPEDRLILIQGNHELLYLELLEKDFPHSLDFSNGTVRTFCQIAGFDEKFLDPAYWFTKALFEVDEDPRVDALSKYNNMPHEYWKQVKETVARSDVTQWIKSNRWINYLETDKYIMVHSWIPIQEQLVREGDKFGYVRVEEIGPREDWRNATKWEWEDATWGCPWQKALNGWNNTGKTIICGHWHTSDFFNNLTKQRKTTYDCPIFKSKKYKLIGLDACTVMSKKVNVLVIEEDEL